MAHKTELNLFCQRNKISVPTYATENTEHGFRGVLRCEGRLFTSQGVHKTKKEAENDVALVAMLALKQQSRADTGPRTVNNFGTELSMNTALLSPRGEQPTLAESQTFQQHDAGPFRLASPVRSHDPTHEFPLELRNKGKPLGAVPVLKQNDFYQQKLSAVSPERRRAGIKAVARRQRKSVFQCDVEAFGMIYRSGDCSSPVQAEYMAVMNALQALNITESPLSRSVQEMSGPSLFPTTSLHHGNQYPNPSTVPSSSRSLIFPPLLSARGSVPSHATMPTGSSTIHVTQPRFCGSLGPSTLPLSSSSLSSPPLRSAGPSVPAHETVPTGSLTIDGSQPRFGDSLHSSPGALPTALSSLNSQPLLGVGDSMPAHATIQARSSTIQPFVIEPSKHKLVPPTAFTQCMTVGSTCSSQEAKYGLSTWSGVAHSLSTCPPRIETEKSSPPVSPRVESGQTHLGGGANAKQSLHKFCHEKKLPNPEYRYDSPVDSVGYICTIRVGEKTFTSPAEKTKKCADVSAAHLALMVLQGKDVKHTEDLVKELSREMVSYKNVLQEFHQKHKLPSLPTYNTMQMASGSFTSTVTFQNLERRTCTVNCEGEFSSKKLAAQNAAQVACKQLGLL